MSNQDSVRSARTVRQEIDVQAGPAVTKLVKKAIGEDEEGLVEMYAAECSFADNNCP